MTDFIAHRRNDGKEQSLFDHLSEVGEMTASFASKLNASNAGKLIGLLHDFGKFSKEFQDYIGSATGKINPDEDEFVDFKGLKGKIDHSSAGAQWVWEYCKNLNGPEQLIGQILSLCIASHHSGLIDCLKIDGENGFSIRMNKEDRKTHKAQCIHNAPKEYQESIKVLLDKSLLKDIGTEINKLTKLNGVASSSLIWSFYQGLWTRTLFSCLIDADRISSADFESPENFQYRHKSIDWSIPISRVELSIQKFKGDKDIDVFRRDISDACKSRAGDAQGIYTLTVPTGGGKTYASLRYALHHAKTHKLDRIIYVIPFTSIIEQNAKAIRKILDCSEDEFSWVLEQHSNLEPEKQSWHSKLVSENWDAPIIMITMVQFLEVLFSSGTCGARKMHLLTNSLLIFDEIQTLPINCTHLFCNAINFLTGYCGTTALLCTATQPLLDQLKSPEKGQLSIPPENELVSNVPKLFADLKRTRVAPDLKVSGWKLADIAGLALTEFHSLGSCLVIVNTKAWAQQLYQALETEIEAGSIFHLSTNLCPAHRKAIFSRINHRLDQRLPVLCVSTQLIEAGVDVDFASVIRFLAGLDSIAQAAGRCNRNGLREIATVHVVNPEQESIDLLPDIKVGRDKARRVLDEGFEDLLAPNALQQYFKYYFFDRADEMAYPVKNRHLGLNSDLLDLLSSNRRNTGYKKNICRLQQSFMIAGKEFKVIDSPTQAVIVPYGEEGRKLISELCRVAKDFDVKKYRQLLRQAQQYSINIFPKTLNHLKKEGAVQETQPNESIYFLRDEYYSNQYGLSEQICNLMPTNIV